MMDYETFYAQNLQAAAKEYNCDEDTASGIIDAHVAQWYEGYRLDEQDKEDRAALSNAIHRNTWVSTEDEYLQEDHQRDEMATEMAAERLYEES